MITPASSRPIPGVLSACHYRKKANISAPVRFWAIGRSSPKRSCVGPVPGPRCSILSHGWTRATTRGSILARRHPRAAGSASLDYGARLSCTGAYLSKEPWSRLCIAPIGSAQAASGSGTAPSMGSGGACMPVPASDGILACPIVPCPDSQKLA